MKNIWYKFLNKLVLMKYYKSFYLAHTWGLIRSREWIVVHLLPRRIFRRVTSCDHRISNIQANCWLFANIADICGHSLSYMMVRRVSSSEVNGVMINVVSLLWSVTIVGCTSASRGMRRATHVNTWWCCWSSNRILLLS